MLGLQRQPPLPLPGSFAVVPFPSLSQLRVSLVSFRKERRETCLDLPGPLFSSPPQRCLEKCMAKQKQFPVFLQCREDRFLQFLKLRERHTASALDVCQVCCRRQLMRAGLQGCPKFPCRSTQLELKMHTKSGMPGAQLR